MVKKTVLSVIFLLLLTALCIAEERLYIEPYIQNVTQKTITIQWWTEEHETLNQVEYGDNFTIVNASDIYISSVGKVLHTADITGLTPETSYKYRVKSGSIVSKEYNFKTAVKRESNFHFAFLGDGRTDNDAVINRHRTILDVAWKEGIDFAIEAGDMVETGEQKHWDRFWRQIATKSDNNNPGINFSSNIPFYLVIGNHEIYNGKENYYDKETSDRFKAYVDNPKNNSINPEWEERYFSFTYGVASFIVIDTNNTSGDFYDYSKELSDGSTPDWEPDSEQYLWLIEELKKAEKISAFTFIVMHPSPYCRGTHGDPNNPISAYPLRALDHIFRKYGVDGVLTSHDHLVEHCLTGPDGFEEKMDQTSEENLNYIIMGNSGHSTREAKKGWEQWMSIKKNNGPPYYTVYFYDWPKTEYSSYLDVKVENIKGNLWKATFKIIRNDKNIYDEFSIERKDPVNNSL